MSTATAQLESTTPSAPAPATATNAPGGDVAAQIADAVAAAVAKALAQQQAQPAPELVDTHGLAAMLDMSYDSIRKLDKLGKIPRGLKFGKCLKWRIKEIQAWLAADCPGRQKWTDLKKVK